MKVIPGRKKGLGFFLQLFVVYFLTSSYHLLAMKKKLIVGEFNEPYPPLMDGVGQVVKNYSECLINEHDYDVRVLTTISSKEIHLAKDDPEYVMRAVMHPVPGLGPYGIVTFPDGLKKKINEIDFDIIHTHSPFFLGQFAEKIVKRRRIPLVTTFHSQFKKDIKAFTKSDMLAGLVTKYLIKHYNKADAVLVPNTNSVDVLRSYGYKGDVRILLNATDMKVPAEEDLEKQKIDGYDLIKRIKLSPPTNKPILLFIGQHREEKNLSLLINSLRKLKDRNIPFYMVFVGEGPGKKQYEEMVENLKLSEDVVFLGKITDRYLIKCLYAISTLFLFPSLYDTSSLVPREASAYSLPLIYINGAATAEGIIDGENGFLSENNADAYSKKIEEVLLNKEIRIKAGVGAKKLLYRSFSDAADDVSNIYQELIEKYSKMN